MAATIASDHQVVTMKPQERQQLQELKVDHNGEEIIMEGACYKLNLYFLLFIFTFVAAICLPVIMLNIIFVVILIFVVIHVCIGIKKWQLYLTRSYIHYHPASLGCNNWTIPLSYINDIRFGGLKIFIYMEKARVAEFIKGCCQCSESMLLDYVTLQNVTNSNEFIAAVKREIAAK